MLVVTINIEAITLGKAGKRCGRNFRLTMTPPMIQLIADSQFSPPFISFIHDLARLQ
jgi:hypothetical protein